MLIINTFDFFSTVPAPVRLGLSGRLHEGALYFPCMSASSFLGVDCSVPSYSSGDRRRCPSKTEDAYQVNYQRRESVPYPSRSVAVARPTVDIPNRVIPTLSNRDADVSDRDLHSHGDAL